MKILMLEAVVRKELHNDTLCARFLCMFGFGMRKLCTLQSDEIGYLRNCYVHTRTESQTAGSSRDVPGSHRLISSCGTNSRLCVLCREEQRTRKTTRFICARVFLSSSTLGSESSQLTSSTSQPQLPGTTPLQLAPTEQTAFAPPSELCCKRFAVVSAAKCSLAVPIPRRPRSSLVLRLPTAARYPTHPRLPHPRRNQTRGKHSQPSPTPRPQPSNSSLPPLHAPHPDPPQPRRPQAPCTPPPEPPLPNSNSSGNKPPDTLSQHSRTLPRLHPRNNNSHPKSLRHTRCSPRCENGPPPSRLLPRLLLPAQSCPLPRALQQMPFFSQQRP